MYVTRKHKTYKRIRILQDLPKEDLPRKIKYMDDEGRTPLMLACLHGDLCEVYQKFCHSEMDAVDDDGWSALMYAAHHGHADIVDFLIEKGVDRNLTTHSGLKASQLAYFNSHYEIYQIIN